MALRLNPLNISIALTAVAYVLMVIFNGLGGAGYKGTIIWIIFHLPV